MRINYILKRLSVVFAFLFITAYSFGQSVTATYNSGGIGSEYNTSASTADTSACPVTMSVTVPAGGIITGVDVSYSIVAQSGAYMSEQRSFLRVLNAGGTAESSLASGSGSSGGTMTYSRTGLAIANGVTGGGNIDFQMNIFRTWGTSYGCDTAYHYIPAGTWTITVHYYMQVALDAGLSNLYTAAGITANQPVDVDLTNFGTTTITSATINWDIDGVAQTPYSWSGSLATNTMATVTIGTANFAAGPHTITAVVSSPNGSTDLNNNNDTASLTQTFIPTATLPFYEDFEGTLNYAWTQTVGSEANVYVRSDAAYMSNLGYYMTGNSSTGFSGSSSASTYSWTNTTHRAILAANFDGTGTTNPKLKFMWKQDSYYGSGGYCWFRVVVNGTPIADINGVTDHNRYGGANPTPWVELEYDLTAYAGTTFNIEFQNESKYNLTTSTYAGATFIDNISVYQPLNNDLAAESWDAPLDGAPLGLNNVLFTVKNNGAVAQTNPPVYYSLDGGTTFTGPETLSATIQPDSFAQHTFTAQANFLSPGYYDFVAVVSNPGDGNTANDTLTARKYICSSLSGVYTIGDTAADFANFSDAVFALNTCGISGAVTFNVAPGTYYEQVELGMVTGASATNTITFQSATGNAADVTLWYDPSSSAIGSNYVFALNGAMYTTIQDITVMSDGLANGYGRCIVLRNGAAYNQVKNNMIYSNNPTTSYTAGIYNYDATTMMNVYSGNNISGVYYGIYIYGTSSSTKGYGNIAAGNDINSQTYGVYCYYQDSAQILNNNIMNLAGASSFYGIYAYYSQGSFNYLKNNIVADGNSGTFYGIYMSSNDAASGNEGMVINNMIAHTNTSSTSTCYGLYLSGSDYINIYNNSVAVSSASSSSSRALYQTSGSNLSFMNNIFANYGPTGYAAYYNTTSAVIANDYNNYYTVGSNFARFGSNVSDLAALQAASLMDLGSQSIAPIFNSPTDLHHFTIPLNNLGSPITAVTDDIDGDLRDPSTPDIGADEYTPLAADVAVVEIVSPVNQCGLTNAEYVTVKVANFGTATQSNIPVSFSFDGGTTVVTESIAGPLLSLDTATYTFTATVDMSVPAIYDGGVAVGLVGDQNTSNDTMFLTIDPYFIAYPANINFDNFFKASGSAADQNQWTFTGSGTSYKWYVHSGGTGSSNTGPYSDYSGSGNYIYTEASSGSNNDTAWATRNCIDLSGYTTPMIGFWYHMTGSHINKLFIEAEVGGAWMTVDSIIGAQQASQSDPWMFKVTDFSSYTSATAFRFAGIRGSSYEGDISIDEVTLFSGYPTVDLGADIAICDGSMGTLMPMVDSTFNWSYVWTWAATGDTLGTGMYLMTDSAGAYSVEAMNQFGMMSFDTINVTVNPLPSVSFTGLNANYCESDAAAMLVGTPAGGDFYIDGVMATASFDPMTVGTGSHVVEYYYTDANGCTNYDMQSTMVNPNPMADAGADQTICEGDTATLTVNANMVMADLFFSEYIEGSSNNKAIEVYNGTGSTVNLDNYRIAQAVNGGGWQYYHTFPTGATLADGATWTIITDQVDTTLFAHSNADEVLSYPSVVHHNGDDARGLEKTMDGGATWTLIDLIGDPNNDPGSGWDVAGVTNGTQNHTMVRKPDVYGGNLNWTAAAGTDSLTSEWLVYPINTFGNLGVHTMTGTVPTFSYLWSTTETTQTIMVNPTATTDYDVVVTNGYGCMAYDTVQVVVNPNPVVNLGSDTALCMYDYITLDAGNPGATYLWSTGETTQTIMVDGSLGAGTHLIDVTVVDANGCTGMDAITVTFNALPTVDLGADTIICEDYGTLTLDLGAGFVGYLWSTGQSSQTITLTADTMTLGNTYTIIGGVMDANGCMNADTIVITVDECTGINDLNGDFVMNIMPNPSNGQFVLKAAGIEGDVTVDVLSVNGQVIHSVSIEALNSSTIVQEFDLSTLAKGVYFVKLYNAQGVRTERIVIQ